MRLPVEDLSLLEPERNLLLGILNRVRSVANVAADLKAEISADSSGGRFQGVGSTEHLPSSGNSLLALPNHGNDRAAQHIISKLGKERFVHKVAVVGLKKLLAGHTSLHGGQLVAFRLESGDDVADNTTLDTIGLDLLRIKSETLERQVRIKATTLTRNFGVFYLNAAFHSIFLPSNHLFLLLDSWLSSLDQIYMPKNKVFQ